ncbi:MAG: hypothetical protein R2746_01465 [Acidimicrobiales bacterium]
MAAHRAPRGRPRRRRRAVTVATFHAAKARAEVVHLAGAEAGLVPISHARTAEARRRSSASSTWPSPGPPTLRCSWAQTRTFGLTLWSEPRRPTSPGCAAADDLAR